MKRRHNISVDEEVWEKSVEKIGKGNVSQKIEDLLIEFLDGDVETSNKSEDIDILDHADLTEKQERLIRELIRENKKSIGLGEASRFADAKGVYSRKDYVKQAIKKIDKEQYSLYKMVGDSLEAEVVTCRECGQKINAALLSNHEGDCPNCGTGILDLSQEELIVEVGT